MFKLNFNEINPHIRFAQRVVLKRNENFVTVKDCRLLYVLSGNASLLTENQTYSVFENNLIYFPAKSVYSFVCDSLELISVNFDLNQDNCSRTKPYIPVTVSEKSRVDRTTETVDFLSPNFILVEDGRPYLETLKSIVNEFNSNKLYCTEKSGGILKNLITDIAINRTLSATHSAHAVKNAIEFINNNFGNKISNKQIAEITGYHEYHLNRLFIKHTGQSLHQYLVTIRINRAKELLLGTDMSLSEIAQRCGFAGSSHFSSYFKQSVGITPYRYREKISHNI